MDFKHGRGVLFWCISAVVLGLLGGSQILMVEGLTCDICYHRFGKTSECKPMPCNSREDLEKAGNVLAEKEQEMSDQRDMFKKRSQLGQPMTQRQTGAGAGKGSPAPEWMCVKSVGLNPTKGFLSKLNVLKVECETRVELSDLPNPDYDQYDGRDQHQHGDPEDSFSLLSFPAARDEPYDGSTFDNYPEYYAGFQVTLCNATNEASCRVTEDELKRSAIPEPAPGDPIRGLECNVCYQVGQFGSKSCNLMPCNTDRDMMKSMELVFSAMQDWITALEKAAGEEHAKGANVTSMGIHERGHGRQGPAGTDARGGQQDKEKFTCQTLLGTADTKLGQLPVKYQSCYSSSSPWSSEILDPSESAFLPRPEPYKTVPDRLKNFIERGGWRPGSPNSTLTVDKFYVCDESNQAVCRDSEPGSGPSGAEGSEQPGSSSSSPSSSLRFEYGFMLLGSSVFMLVTRRR